ncbi:hypothetical protein EHYA_02168 [Embleya hyalina]|uniref:Uncharacterized protein n=1 Tax=Embleya hyalina TaxID=516124 RepID=A0A401YJ01_9ACTN|nr:hypothetical protein EHYA_02168 [Embleya hyalina]
MPTRRAFEPARRPTRTHHFTRERTASPQGSLGRARHATSRRPHRSGAPPARGTSPESEQGHRRGRSGGRDAWRAGSRTEVASTHAVLRPRAVGVTAGITRAGETRGERPHRRGVPIVPDAERLPTGPAPHPHTALHPRANGVAAGIARAGETRDEQAAAPKWRPTRTRHFARERAGSPQGPLGRARHLASERAHRSGRPHRGGVPPARGTSPESEQGHRRDRSGGRDAWRASGRTEVAVQSCRTRRAFESGRRPTRSRHFARGRALSRRTDRSGRWRRSGGRGTKARAAAACRVGGPHRRA